MPSWTAIAPILLLVASNVFMTFAWYGQLKVEHRAAVADRAVSWGIAFFEYCWRCRPTASGGSSTSRPS